MKRTIILTAFFAFAVSISSAQIAGGRISIDDLTVRRAGDNVEVNYTAKISRRAVRRDHTLVFAPVIMNGEYAWSLPAVVVQGRGSKIARRRREWVARETLQYENSVAAKNRQTLNLSAVVPLQDWMHGGDVIFESVDGGCCTYRRADDILLTENILPRPTTAVRSATQPADGGGWTPITVADSLSTSFPFVLPASEFDPDEPFKIYDDERDGAMEIYFHVNKSNIDPYYLDNAYTLANLVGTIEIILASRDSRVQRVVVGGFASPEGSVALNDRLAFDRALAVKRYVVSHTGLRDSQVEVYNGSADWRGLRVRVAKSDLPERDKVLDIIDNTPIWDGNIQIGRLGTLMRLSGGATYRYLLREHFPYLRSGAFIKVYYENK